MTSLEKFKSLSVLMQFAVLGDYLNRKKLGELHDIDWDTGIVIAKKNNKKIIIDLNNSADEILKIRDGMYYDFLKSFKDQLKDLNKDIEDLQSLQDLKNAKK